MKVLLAFDGTPASERALKRLTELLPGQELDVVVLGVCVRTPEPVVAATEGGVGLWPGPDMQAAEHHLAWACHELATCGITARVLLREGQDTTETVLAAAEELQVDLIVTGCHHKGWLGRLLLGSVSAGLAARASTPLLIVP